MSGEKLLEILTTAEMYEADRLAIEGGVAGETLMENAGRAVCDVIRNRWARRNVTILCGPGNNGGDGFVIARLLSEAGWPVRLGLLGDESALNGDAAIMAERWQGATEELSPALLDDTALIVDALFGAGLDRPLKGAALEILQAVSDRALPCVAVDMPSGVQGDSGAIMGHAVRCRETVTFFRRKPGHLLLPGRTCCGAVTVADIGIPASVCETIQPACGLNDPAMWKARFAWPDQADHKYGRGHVVVVGGAEMTGAARLAARAAARSGAGLVTIASPPSAADIYAADLPVFLISPVANAEELSQLLSDKRKNAAVIGPGCGVNLTTRMMVLSVLEAGIPTVLDADGLSVFADKPVELFEAIGETPIVLTPHEGEFSRLFDFTGNKLDRVRQAADRAGAVVLLKGSDTVIAEPGGRAVINNNAPPTLATGGAGDVLAGMISGLMAQGMQAFDAAAAGCWLHGDAAADFGPGLIASDIPDVLPGVLARLVG